MDIIEVEIDTIHELKGSMQPLTYRLGRRTKEKCRHKSAYSALASGSLTILGNRCALFSLPKGLPRQLAIRFAVSASGSAYTTLIQPGLIGRLRFLCASDNEGRLPLPHTNLPLSTGGSLK